MDRVQNYFRQKVTAPELLEMFNFAEAADHNLIDDLQLNGIASGLDVTPAAPEDLTVNVATGTAYDKNGRRLRLPSPQNVDLEFDTQPVPQSTAVVTPGNERVVSLFLEFDRAESDVRTDGNGMPVNYKQLETIGFHIVAGTESAPPAVPPVLDPTRILLADVRLVFNQTQIFAADIEIGRREPTFSISEGDVTFTAGTIAEGLSSLAVFADEARGVAERVPATAGVQLGTGTPGTFTTDGDFNIGANTNTLTIPISVAPSRRLVSVWARVTDQDQFGGGTTTLTVRKNVDGVGSNLGTETSDQSGDPQTLAVTGLTEDFGAPGADVGTTVSAVFTFAGAIPQTVHAVEWAVETIPTP